MRYAEIGASRITYRVSRVGPTSDFEDAVEGRLYTRRALFLKWFLRPEQWFKEGGIAVRAYDGDTLIGIGIFNADANFFSQWIRKLNQDKQRFVGIIGFFVKEAYRARGIASEMARRLEREFLKSYRIPRVPLALCSGDACGLAQRAFKKLTVAPYGTLGEALTEARSAPLYRALDPKHARNALDRNEMIGSGAHEIDGLRRRGLSFTRDFDYAKRWQPVVLVLDQARVAQRHRIAPFSHRGFRDPKHEREEFVVADRLPDLDRYLLGIYVEQDRRDRFDNADYDDEDLRAIVQHPKFKGYY